MTDSPRLAVIATHPIQYHAPLYRALVEAGVDLTVFFAHRPTAEEQGVGFGVPFQWDVDLTSGYRHVFLENRATSPSTSGFWGCDVPAVREVITAGAFDVVLLSGWHSRAYLQALAASRRAKIPVLVRGDSQLLPGQRLGVRLAKRLLYPVLLRQFAVCLAVGTRSEAYFRHYGARRVVRAPHFVDNAFYARAADAERVGAQRGLRARLGIPPEQLVFLFAGKFSAIKRPLDFVRALAELPKGMAVGLFVGDGALRAACAREAERRGVDARFTGFLNQRELPAAYAAADAIVVSSESETWGLVVNEAMACGLPAVVTDRVGCGPDLIVEGETGRVYPMGDVSALASSLASLASDRGALADMGRAARSRIAAFTAGAAAAGVLRGCRIAREADVS